MMKQVKRRNKALGLVMALAGSGVLIPTVTHADTVESLTEEKNSIDELLESIEKEVEQTEKQSERMEERFERTEERIAETEEEIDETLRRIQIREEIINKRLSSLQMNGGAGSYLEVLFGSRDFGQFISRMTTVNSIMDSDRQLLNSQKEDRELLEEQITKLHRTKNSLGEQFNRLQEKLTELEVKKAEQEVLRIQLEEKIEDAKEKDYWTRFAEIQTRKFETLSIEGLAKGYSELTDEEKEHIDFDEELHKKRQQIVTDTIEEASKYIGGEYVWGGDHPSTSFDCSGLLQWSFKQAGVELPRTAAQQYMATERIAAEDVKVGDLVFFSYGQGIAHVGIYVGDGKMLNAQNSGIKIANLSGYWEQYIAGFGRVPGL